MVKSHIFIICPIYRLKYSIAENASENSPYYKYVYFRTQQKVLTGIRT